LVIASACIWNQRFLWQKRLERQEPGSERSFGWSRVVGNLVSDAKPPHFASNVTNPGVKHVNHPTEKNRQGQFDERNPNDETLGRLKGSVQACLLLR
jgi:hypothetical protein